MTSSSHLCLVSKIWQWCIPRRIWTIVSHISQFKLSTIHLTLMLLKSCLKGYIWIIPLNDIEINVSASFPNCCFAPTSLTLICQSRSTKEEWRKNSQEWDESFHSLAARINEIHNSMSFIRLTFTYSLRLLATNSHCQSSSSDGSQDDDARRQSSQCFWDSDYFILPILPIFRRSHQQYLR